VNIDFSTFKDFRVREGQALQFRMEMFNAPNHVELGTPNTGWGSSNKIKEWTITPRTTPQRPRMDVPLFNSFFLFGALVLAQALFAQQPCEKLAGQKGANSEVTSAVLHPAGPVSGGTGNPPINAPARCVVTVIARPVADSAIKMEIWLPAANWNGKYMQAGNGGWAGTVPIRLLAVAVERGYAVAGTNGGHDAGDGSGPAGWAVGHPE
jgi:hypothetical protein